MRWRGRIYIISFNLFIAVKLSAPIDKKNRSVGILLLGGGCAGKRGDARSLPADAEHRHESIHPLSVHSHRLIVVQNLAFSASSEFQMRCGGVCIGILSRVRSSSSSATSWQTRYDYIFWLEVWKFFNRQQLTCDCAARCFTIVITESFIARPRVLLSCAHTPASGRK